MKIAVVGGGINGLCVAWELSNRGHRVTLFERGQLLQETSRASTKLLHGGLRYLEFGQWRMVREALLERRWWLDNVPQHTARQELWLPIYQASLRPRWKLKIGLWLYDVLAGSQNVGRHKWFSQGYLKTNAPELIVDGLRGGYRFYDGQMDEEALGDWVVGKAIEAGVSLRTACRVERVDTNGSVYFADQVLSFDRVINAVGPWVTELLEQSNLVSGIEQDLVRGSHFFLARASQRGYLLQVPGEKRIVFVLPYKQRTLVGTTEVRQGLTESIRPTDDEIDYLLAVYNAYLRPAISRQDIVETYAGLRPLIRSTTDPGRATREYLVESMGKLINVYGGKWTTSRALARAVAEKI